MYNIQIIRKNKNDTLVIYRSVIHTYIHTHIYIYTYILKNLRRSLLNFIYGIIFLNLRPKLIDGLLWQERE